MLKFFLILTAGNQLPLAALVEYVLYLWQPPNRRQTLQSTITYVSLSNCGARIHPYVGMDVWKAGHLKAAELRTWMC